MKNLIIGILMSLPIIGCSEKKVLLSPAEMKEDIQFYFHLIRDIHPDPYQRYDSITFVTLEAKMIESCTRPMTANNTYSAGADFCLTIKISNAAILVGEETGQYYPICGNVIMGTLPNSKIQYQMPSTETFYGIPNGHIHPDIPYPLKEEMGLDDYKEIIILSSS